MTRTAPVTRPFRTPVRGHAFAARTPGAADPAPGQLARLVREPGNPADPYAVSVWVADATGRWRLGYLDRGVAARIAPRLDGGMRIAAQVEGWTPEPEGRWHRPLLVILPDAGDTSPRTQPNTASPSREDPSTAPQRPAHEAGLWGRPPGVSRRIVRRATSAAGAG